MPKILLFLLIFLNFTPVFSLDLPVSQIPDDSLLRIKLKDSWMIDTPRNVLALRPRLEYLESGEKVQVRATEGREEIMVSLSRELAGGRIASGDKAAVPRAGTGNFPGWAQGSWMLTRRKDTGAGIMIRIFPRSDQNTYIQFRPFDNEKCQMDAVIYGGYIMRSMPVAVPFERLYTIPLNDLLKLVESKFPLRYFEIDPLFYKDTRNFISKVREKIGSLNFLDDGAIDENGNYVFIETMQNQSAAKTGLNCSGFAKWLIDGLLRPVTGRRLSVASLKAPFGERGSSFTANWEARDTFFGLDWIRNLASEANGVLRSPSYRALEEFEVRADYFSLILVNEKGIFNTNSYPGFLREAGYGTEGLRPLLYALAVDNPFSFYLAAVNTEFGTPQNIRGTPRLREYYHIAALVPYFDEYGVFKIAVFESAAETSFTAFRNRYPGQFVNLVKIPVTGTFDP